MPRCRKQFKVLIINEVYRAVTGEGSCSWLSTAKLESPVAVNRDEGA